MFKIKKIFLCGFCTLLLASVLAAPASALNVADNIDYGFIQINDSGLLQSKGTLPSYFITKNSSVTSPDLHISNYGVYIPLVSNADAVSFIINLWSGVVTSYGTLDVSYGTLNGSTYTRIGTLSSDLISVSWTPQEYYLYGDKGNYKIGRIFDIDTSGIDVNQGSIYLRVFFSNSNFDLRMRLFSYAGINGSSEVYWDNRALGFTIAASELHFSAGGLSSGTNYYPVSSRTVNGYFTGAALGSRKVQTTTSSLSLRTDDLSPFSFVYSRTSDDSEAVAQLQQINGTLDGMASNLQTITDDFKARENAGNEIGGTATDQDVSAGTSGLSNGNSSISSGIAGLPSFADVMSPAVGYISFLTAPVQLMFSFGNGYLLYIATAMVILSVIFFIIRRMGGGSGD